MVRETVDVDASIFAAGDHHGSTIYQQEKFLEMARNRGQPGVNVENGLMSVATGRAAEFSAKTGQVVDFTDFLNCNGAA